MVDKSNQCVLVTGDIFTGLIITGPFGSHVEADLYGFEYLSKYRVIPCEAPTEPSVAGTFGTENDTESDQAVIDSYFPDDETQAAQALMGLEVSDLDTEQDQIVESLEAELAEAKAEIVQVQANR